jgi:progressive ankylosis protein
MSDQQTTISLRKIFSFWLPLAATWLMMSVEGPFLAALIARLAEPKFNLAAYGVAFSFALIIEAPVIMIMSASTALVKNYQSFLKLRNFTFILNTVITLIMLLLLVPHVFYFITEDLIKLPHSVAKLTHIATIILIPWPGAIGYRRFYQGLLIRNDLTRRVAYGTIIRISTMGITALILFIFSDVPGVVVGASSLSAAVIMEAIASRIMAGGVIDKLKSNGRSSQEELTYKFIYSFYYPLALTSLIGLGVQPLVTFFVGQSRMALESLAVLPVITSFVFIFRSLGLSYQEVVIALMGRSRETYPVLRKFAIILGGTLTLLLSLIAFTPLSDFWFSVVSGLTENLTEFSKLPLMLMAVFPALTVLVSLQRAILVNGNNTRPITYGTGLEFVIIIVVLFLCINIFSLVGAVAAAAAFVLGRIAANIYLTIPVVKTLKG